eukprot:6227122-Alexandrium_andersonii.AAC.1
MQNPREKWHRSQPSGARALVAQQPSTRCVRYEFVQLRFPDEAEARAPQRVSLRATRAKRAKSPSPSLEFKVAVAPPGF